MTPKKKAKELYEKMLFCYQGHIDEYTAKQCALIAVDEILKEHRMYLTLTFNYVIKYWEEVKQEIKKL